MKLPLFKVLCGAGLTLAAGLAVPAYAATSYANVAPAGVVLPGVYGRVEFGTAPPPPLIYPKPVIIYGGPQAVQQPVYLHVPPGHAKKWSKHCAKYNACSQPVYFVRADSGGGGAGAGGAAGQGRQGQGEYKDNKKEKHHGNGNGKSKGKHDD